MAAYYSIKPMRDTKQKAPLLTDAHGGYTKLPAKDELWDADPKCKHDIKPQPGGGVKCTKCSGWYCF